MKKKDDVVKALKSAKDSINLALRDIRKGREFFPNLDDAWAEINGVHASVDEGETPSNFAKDDK